MLCQENSCKFLYPCFRAGWERKTFLVATNPTVRRALERLERRKQNVSMRIRLFSEELAELKNRAVQCGKTLSDYVREKCLAETVSQSSSTVSGPALSFEGNEQVCESFSIEDSLEDGRARKTHANVPRIAVKSSVNSREVGTESDRQVSLRTGHKNVCVCFACRRLREMLDAQRKK